MWDLEFHVYTSMPSSPTPFGIERAASPVTLMYHVPCTCTVHVTQVLVLAPKILEVEAPFSADSAENPNSIMVTVIYPTFQTTKFQITLVTVVHKGFRDPDLMPTEFLRCPRMFF